MDNDSTHAIDKDPRKIELPKTREERLDRWGDGPWVDEPDRVEWEAYGLPCLMVRNKLMGNWCGYAAVPPGHPCYGRQPDDEVRVHGGVTFGGLCHGEICHVPKPGEPDNVWWVGFDCAHGGDYMPAVERMTQSRLMPESVRQTRAARDLLARRLNLGDKYRDLEYVKNETTGLAAQLAYLGGNHEAAGGVVQHLCKPEVDEA